MHLENNSKILSKFIHHISEINLKAILHIGLLLFWAVIIVGTFKEFI